MVKRHLVLMLLLATVALLGNKCAGGNGSGGKPPTRQVSASGDCAPIVGQFPPGFSWLPESDGHAAAVQDSPAGVLFFDMNGRKPKLLARDEISPVPTDSDGDGEVDEDQRLCNEDENDEFVSMGSPLGVSERLAFVAGSGFEQVMFFRSPNGELTEFTVTNPPDTLSGSYRGEDYPYLPQVEDDRTAITTKACIYLTDDLGTADETSIGDAIGQHDCCDRIADKPSFMTSFTSEMGLASGHLFVATANLDVANSFRGRYYPGTVLVYDYDREVDTNAIQPNTETPVIFTTGFNPTGVSTYETPSGRELVFVTNTGALLLGVGPSNILTESFIDVIDAASRTLVATIPLGLAGASFNGVAIDPAKRVGFVGSWTLPVIYAIDLRVFDDEDLFDQDDVVLLDGSDPVFPDARIFHADNPFEIPDRADGPHPILCDGWTFVAINEAGETAHVIERCDGTLTEVNLLEPEVHCEDAGSSRACCDEIPLPETCFSVGAVRKVTEPFNAVTGLHGPSQISVRPGEPGVDYVGPDVFFTVDLPEGQLCGLSVDSF